MKIEVRETKQDGLIQITTLDERWYRREEDSKLFPSSSWISDYVPKGYGFYEWVKTQGENATAIFEARGEIGGRVHQAIDALVARKMKDGKGFIDIQNEVFGESDNLKQLNGEECEIVLSWVNWWKELEETYTVKIIDFEQAQYNDEVGYAGTRDLRLKLELKAGIKPPKENLSGTWTIDYKISKSIYTSHIAQLSSYRHFPGCENDRLAILQIGYNLNKRHYKFSEQEDRFDLFLAAKTFWATENADKHPHQFELPQLLTI
jgi:hypothetical protein